MSFSTNSVSSHHPTFRSRPPLSPILPRRRVFRADFLLPPTAPNCAAIQVFEPTPPAKALAHKHRHPAAANAIPARRAKSQSPPDHAPPPPPALPAPPPAQQAAPHYPVSPPALRCAGRTARPRPSRLRASPASAALPAPDRLQKQPWRTLHSSRKPGSAAVRLRSISRIAASANPKLSRNSGGPPGQFNTNTASPSGPRTRTCAGR